MIPLIAMAAGTAIQAGGAIAKSISGARRMKKAQEALNQYERQTLQNAVRGKVGVSRLAADLQSEQMARATATSVDALASGGVRGMVGGIGRVQANNLQAQRQIGADLDKQQQQINMAAAQDDTRIRQMQEQREREDLAGLGSRINAGRQDLYGGIGDIGQSLTSLGGMMGTLGMGMGPRNPVSSVDPGGALSSQAQTSPTFQDPMAGTNTTLFPTSIQTRPQFANPMLGQNPSLMPNPYIPS